MDIIRSMSSAVILAAMRSATGPARDHAAACAIAFDDRLWDEEAKRPSAADRLARDAGSSLQAAG